MKKISIKSVVWKEGKHYVAQCLNFDISSFGSSKKLAIKNLREAIELYIEDLPLKKIISVSSPEVIESNIQYA